MADMKTVFVLGAGASHEAGIPTINSLSEEFVNDPTSAISPFMIYDDESIDPHIIRKVVPIISKITFDFNKKMDLELMMSLILRLENPQEKNLLESKYSELKEIDQKIIHQLKDVVQGYIRYKCEGIISVDYLWPLKGMCEQVPLDIFTLNYDGTIESFCEKNSIPYTDGFYPDWKKEQFNENYKIKLYKLHGSLYWLKTNSNKTMKVPIRGLRISDIKYLTDESVSEMMIYPTLAKNKQLGVYSWLGQRFKDTLNESEICIIIGYSFRDEDITESIIEALNTNQKLWLILVNPDATKHKTDIFPHDNEIRSRIITMNMTASEALTDRNLHQYLQKIETARKVEIDAQKSQATSQIRLDTMWNHILQNYILIGHHDRIKWIVEELSEKKFSNPDNNFPTCIEGIVGPLAIQYIIDYHDQNLLEKCDVWKKIFVDSCIALDHRLFQSFSYDVGAKHNPITESELPFFCMFGGQPIQTLMQKMKESLQEIKNIEKGEIQNYCKMLIKTLDIYQESFKSRTLESCTKFAIIWEENDLGLKRWGTKLVNCFKTNTVF